MTTLREAAQLALEALEALQGGCTDSDDGTVEAITVWCPEVITALRAALAEPPPHQYPLQSDRMWIDPVTGDVSIGTPQRPTEPVRAHGIGEKN